MIPSSSGFLRKFNQSLSAHLLRHASSHSPQSKLLTEKSVDIKTCKNVYSSESAKKSFLFRKCPASGIDIRVKYVDSLPSASYNAPTVLAVHGAPGSYNDFHPLLDQLADNGFRVISPNFPTHEFTNETQTFRHTTEEKAEFLQDWMKEIDVKRVDVAVMHSSSCFPTLQLWNDSPGLIKSLFMINTPGYRTIKAMKPEFYTAFASVINTHPLGAKIFKALGGTRPFRGVRNDRSSADYAILACQTMHFAGKERMKDLVTRIRETRTPCVYYYSDKDKLIGMETFRELLCLLGVEDPEDAACKISRDGEILEEGSGKNSDWLRVLCVKDGGHYAFKSCSGLLAKEISKLLAQVYMTDVLKPVEFSKFKNG